MLFHDVRANYQGIHPETMISRRAWIGLGLLVGLLGSAHGVYWRIMAERLETGIADWVAKQRQSGAEIEFTLDGVHGFPLSFRAEFRSPRLELPLSPELRLALSGRSIRAEMRPWNWREIIFASTGHQQFALIEDGRERALRVTTEAIHGRVSLHANGGLAELEIEAQGVAAVRTGSGLSRAASLKLGLELPGAPPRDFKSALGKISLAAEAIELPPGTMPLDSQEIEYAAIEAEIKGPAPVAPLVPMLRAWSSAGGVIEAKRLAFRQGTLSIAGDATIALDQNLQPMGAGRIEAQGLVPLLDRLAAQGLIEPGQANLAGVAIRALESPGQDGKLTARFGLSLQERLLRLGPVPLMKMPEIRW